MYVRKVKKGGKTYLYYYKSERKGDKVKSVYVGKALEKPVKDIRPKEPKQLIKKNDAVNNLMELDHLFFELNRLITLKDLKTSVAVYNQMLENYSKIDLKIEDKQKIFDKLDKIYEELASLSKEHNIDVE